MYTAPFIFPGQDLVRWIFVFMLINHVAMCGQKGPLRLPENAVGETTSVAVDTIRVRSN